MSTLTPHTLTPHTLTPHSHSHSHSTHYDWLRLIEVSGPFLSPTVLDTAFPLGFDGLDKHVKRELSHYYDEWLEAVETQDPQLEDLHKAWCEAVLRVGLEFQDGDLSDGIGYSVDGEGGLGIFTADRVLKDLDGNPVLFVKFLPARVKPGDRDADDVWKDTYIEKMTRLCRNKEVRLGLVTNGEEWVLVNAAPGGTLSGHVTWYARLWFQEDTTLRAFIGCLGYRRFTSAKETRLPHLLDESLKHLEEVTDTLGRQVMLAVEVLLEGLDRADLDSGRTLLANVSPRVLYEASLTVMMRLVFILCAEERGLLLLGEKIYDDVYAISTLRKQLEEDSDKFGPQVLECRRDAWSRLLATFRAIYAGIDHTALKLPAMGGSLFDPDKFPFLEGRAVGMSWTEENPPPLPIDNRTVLLLLESLQVLKHKDGAMPLSFRSLDVEQIGYVYEGLLEATAKKADDLLLGLKGDKSHPSPEVRLSDLESLALDSKEKLIASVRELTGRTALEREYDAEPDAELLPLLTKVCRGNEELKERIKPYLNWMRLSAWGEPVVYHPGTFYVASGLDRRASGAHYTPKQLTEMIVKEALEPVVYVGPAEGKPRGEWVLKSSAELLNLKICDIAMGSGAFLVQVCRYLADRLVDAWAIAEKEEVGVGSESGSGRDGVPPPAAGGRAGAPRTPHKCIDSQGRVVDYPPKEPMSNAPDDRLCEARRLVAEKCLYGVDINPLAVELAKLSLWLVTISKGRPFGFLDHNLKSGDTLLGVTDVKQLLAFRMKPDAGASGNLMTASIEKAVAEAAAEREAIRNARTLDIRDIQLQMQHHQNAEKILANVRVYADYFVGEVFVLGKTTDKNGKITTKAAKALDGAAFAGGALLNPEADSFGAAQAKRQSLINLAHDLPAGQTAARRPFHWALEFPEVFAQGGFDAIVGNPPFMGGQHITGNFGTAYRDYLVNHIADGVKGSADFVAYFYLRAYSLLKPCGIFSLIACNTIAEGDTRQVGLERMVKNGATIIAAHPNMPWPGAAGVAISPVGIFKGANWNGGYRLLGINVEVISPFLSGQDEWTPRHLVGNENQSFIGSYVLGMGFTLTDAEANALLEKDSKNADVIFPYLNGEDLNSDPTQKPSRWVINFYDWPLDRSGVGCWAAMSDDEKSECYAKGIVPSDYPEQVVSDFPDLLAIVDEKVRPERQRLNERGEYVLRSPLPQRWWQYGEKRPALYHTIGRGHFFARHTPNWLSDDHKPSHVLACSLVSKYLAIAAIKNDRVFTHRLCVMKWQGWGYFALMNSPLYENWARKNSSSLETRLNYSPSDCYETFPFPKTLGGDLDALGERFDSSRRAIMTDDQIGLTQLYNRFHDPNETDARFVELRALQVKIDNAVRDAYGWSDIDLGHDFHEVGYLPANDNVRYTISEEARIEVLKRLAKLNKERWEEEESAGLHKKGKKK